MLRRPIETTKLTGQVEFVGKNAKYAAEENPCGNRVLFCYSLKTRGGPLTR